MTADYAYSALDLDEYLAKHNPADVTIGEIFKVGENYGADLERGAIIQSIEGWIAQAAAAGMTVPQYMMYRWNHES